MSSVISLKPCPFCGASLDKVSMWDGSPPPYRLMGLQAIVCRGCHVVGPIRPSIDDAIVAWNKRAEAAPITRTAVPEYLTCVFFERYPVEGQPPKGTCHRHPKPYVRVSSYWCGEWKEGKR